MSIYDDEHVARAYPSTTGRRAEDNKRAALGQKPLGDDLTGGRGWQSHKAGGAAVKATFRDSQGVQRLESKVFGANPSGRTVIGSDGHRQGVSKSDRRKYDRERKWDFLLPSLMILTRQVIHGIRIMNDTLTPRVVSLIKRRMMNDMDGCDTLELVESMVDVATVDRCGDIVRINQEVEKILELARKDATVPTDQVVDEIKSMLDLYIQHDLASYECRFRPVGFAVHKAGIPHGELV